jgi:hypothetical protein
MDDKTINYKGLVSNGEKILNLIAILVASLILFFVGTNAIHLESRVASIYGLFLAVITLLGALVVLLDRNIVVSISPDGKVRIGGSWVRRKDNTYSITSGKASTNVTFLFTLSNISEVYRPTQPVPGTQVITGMGHYVDITNLLCRKMDKAVCFVFKSPLSYYNLGIRNKDFLGRERPPLQKVCVNVADPEKLIQDVRLRAGIAGN